MTEMMDKLHKWAAIHNLSQIVHFHNDLRACLRQALAATETDGSTSEASNKAQIHYYDSSLKLLPDAHLQNCSFYAFKAATQVRIPLGTPEKSRGYSL
jgi:hypothetical protein